MARVAGEVVAWSALGMIVYGLSLLHPALAWIFSGVALAAMVGCATKKAESDSEKAGD